MKPHYHTTIHYTTPHQCVHSRLAATSLAQRVAEELPCRLGYEVGFKVRFEEALKPETKIKFMTGGILLREAISDPALDRYSVIMVDEAHERNLDIDLLLGYLKVVRFLFRLLPAFIQILE